MFPLGALDSDTPRCKSSGPQCAGMHASEGNSTWADMVGGSAFRAFKRAMTNRREQNCPFASLTQTLERAYGMSCPSRCQGVAACCTPRGHANKLRRLERKDAAELKIQSAILRTSKLTRESRETEKLLEGAFMTQLMGQLGIGPKVHALWLSTDTSQISMVIEEYTPLPLVLNRTHAALKGVQDSVIRHVDAVAGLGVVLLDIHPGNVLVSQRPDGTYDTRLTDFDIKFVVRAEYLPLICRKLIMLALFSTVLSCGFAPRQAFSRLIVDYDLAMDPHSRCRGEPAHLLGRLQNTWKGEGEWSSLSMQLKSHVISLMKRPDVIPRDSPCRLWGNYTVSHFGILRTLLRLPQLHLPQL